MIIIQSRPFLLAFALILTGAPAMATEDTASTIQDAPKSSAQRIPAAAPTEDLHARSAPRHRVHLDSTPQSRPQGNTDNRHELGQQAALSQGSPLLGAGPLELVLNPSATVPLKGDAPSPLLGAGPPRLN